MLGYIQTEKANLSQNKKRQTDAYVMLSIAEKMQVLQLNNDDVLLLC